MFQNQVPPTPTPTPAPTATYIPTSGTPHPTIPPSPPPTKAPTPNPTPLPTAPSPKPTPVPTIFCADGSALTGVGVCEPCTIGRFSNHSDRPPFSTWCELCPAGTFASTQGSSSCLKCAVGKLSSSDRTVCSDCQAGQHSQDDAYCVNCPFGQFAPVALADACLPCGAGSFTDNRTGSTLCSACDAGRFSGGQTDTCLPCPAGKFSGGGSSSCVLCPSGSSSATPASPSCTACPAGRSQGATGTTACEPCVAGRFQPATSQNTCDECEVGKYAEEAGALACATCAFGYDALPGASLCDRASSGYFLLGSAGSAARVQSAACPANADCSMGALFAPVPEAGFWVDRSSYAYASAVYDCPRENCKGGQKANSSCWSHRAYGPYAAPLAEDDDAAQPALLGPAGGGGAACEGSYCGGPAQSVFCDSAEVLCEKGSTGPLCGTCEYGYIFRTTSRTCELCQAAEGTTFAVLAVGAALALVAVLVGYGWLRVPCVRRNPVLLFLSHIDGGSLKVVWVTYQLVASTSFNLQIVYPFPFNDLLGILGFFSLDFLALECFQDAADRYFINVYLWSALPMFFSASLFVLMMLRLFAVGLWGGDGKELRAHKITSQHTWLFLFLTYVVLPPVAMKQFQVMVVPGW